MSEFSRNLILIGIFTFFIVDLALKYDSFKDCSKPIHHWYMGFISLALIHRLLMVLNGCCPPNSCISNFLILILGPLTVLFVFVWNVVGTVFLASITRSENRQKCISNSTIFVDWLFISFIFLIYLLVFVLIWIFIKMALQLKRKKTKSRAKLSKVYGTLLKPISNLKDEQIQSLLNDIKTIQNSDKKILAKLPLFREEEKILKLFYRPGSITNLDNDQETLVQKETSVINMDQDIKVDTEDLKEPLLQIMGRDTKRSQLESRISNIQQNADEDSDDCIICFMELMEEASTLVLKCGHKFHESCLTEWLRINPTCPMCRRNFRVDLLAFVDKFLNDVLSKRKSGND